MVYIHTNSFILHTKVQMSLESHGLLISIRFSFQQVTHLFKLDPCEQNLKLLRCVFNSEAHRDQH